MYLYRAFFKLIWVYTERCKISGKQIEQLIEAIAAAQSGAMYLDAKVRHVVSKLKPSAPQNSISPLREREMEVLRLLIEGRSNLEIAELLFISESTVKAHLRSIMDKFGVNDRVQVAVVALRSGLM